MEAQVMCGASAGKLADASTFWVQSKLIKINCSFFKKKMQYNFLNLQQMLIYWPL